ncbi:MAG: hypothetical protein ACRDZ4_06560 [Egibacteraceae bacterium]
MDPRAALFRQFDPMRPLGAEEESLYVDWQNELDLTDDVKQRLVNAITFDRGPLCRLFTGHRGAGKTTELNRVKQRLEAGEAGRRFFVSMLFAEEWVDLEDVQPEDLVFQVVRQLVLDLQDAGCAFAATRFRNFFSRFRKAVAIEGIELGTDPLKVSLTLKDLPTARPQFRKLLQGQLPTIYDLVNVKILAEARRTLAERGFEDILVIIDQLDRIPQKLINGRGLTNHENLFLDHAGTLRALTCNVLYTVPIELAYSHCQNRLQDVYGGSILTLPAIPVRDRDGEDSPSGLRMLREIVERRARKAEVALDGTFESPKLLTEVLKCSGGHIRGLFVLLRSILERTDKLPITQALVDRSLGAAAADMARPLRPGAWKLLDEVRASHQPVGEDPEAWNGLLRDRFVLAYRDERGDWYDRNPLLELVQPERRS